MAYEAKTQNDLAKWWVIGTGSVVNRLSEIMDDFPLGPAIYYTTGWTAGTAGIALTVSINTAGSGYTALDVLTLTGGGNDCTVRVDAVDGGGGVTAITLLTGGTAYSVTNYAVTGGTGADDARINVLTITVEYYRTSAQSTANDSTQEKIGAGAWAALVAGSGIGALAAGEWVYSGGNLYVRLTGDVVPSATNQVRAHYVWDGSGAGPAIMTEVIENALYRIHLHLDVGDASTATTLESLREMVYFDDACAFTVRAYASLYIGKLYNSYGGYGSTWRILGRDSAVAFINLGTLYVCNSRFEWHTGKIYQNGGSFYIYESVLDGNNQSYQGSTAANLYARSVDGFNMLYFNWPGGTIVSEDIHLHTIVRALADYNTSFTVANLRLTDVTAYEVYSAGIGSTIIVIVDPYSFAGNVRHDSSVCETYLKYTINIHINDKDGANLQGVKVNLYGSETTDYDTAAWTEDSVTTAADGTIAEQTVTVKKWVGTSETLTDYNVFKLVCSKAGYETLTLENITIDGPIDWHLELQDAIKLSLDGKRYEALPEQRLRSL